MNLEQLRYPVGRFQPLEDYDEIQRNLDIATIKSFPQKLTGIVLELSEDQLDTPYRPDGWTVRQVVHHVADSHMNSYIRYRWTLTEESPEIKVYNEKLWAELPDAKSAPIKFSLNILKAIHGRWVLLLERMTDTDFERTLHHPEMNQELSLNFMTQLYTWHCNHHSAHITSLIDRKGW